MKKIFSFFLALTASVGMSWADVIPCTAADLGKVLCTDGSIYATVSDATAASKTAAAVIAYIDTENNKGLALALADDGEMNWATAKTTAPAHTPAVSGGTWTLASKDDWDNMITAAGGYEALRDGFSAVGGTNMQQDAYWSSTPENDLAWIFYFAYGGKWVDGYVDDPSWVRACLAFDVPAPTTYAVALKEGTANADKVKLSATKAEENATVTVTPVEGYEIKAFAAKYTTGEGTYKITFSNPMFGSLKKTINSTTLPHTETFDVSADGATIKSISVESADADAIEATKKSNTVCEIKIKSAFSGWKYVSVNLSTTSMDAGINESITCKSNASTKTITATLNPETGAYSFTMPAYDVTIEATIAEKSTTAIDEISQEPKAKSQKLIKNGQLLILRDGKTYTATGQETK